MRPQLRNTLPIFTLGLLCGLATAQRGDRGRRWQADDTTIKLENFRFEKVDYDAPSIDDEKAVYGIYLPEGYDDDENAATRYPWAIWLHGMNGSYQRFHHRGGAETLDTLLGEEKIPPMIVVAPSGARRTLYIDGERGGDRETQIVRDLIAHVNANYRVAEDRSRRAIMGVSIGGTGALKFGLRHRDKFGVVASLSAALFPADLDVLGDEAGRYLNTARRMGWTETLGDPIEKEKWQAFMPTAILEQLEPADLADTRLFVDAGSDDRYGFGVPNTVFHARLTERGIRHTWNLRDGGGHSWSSPDFLGGVQAALLFVGRAFAPETAEAAATGEEAGKKDGRDRP